ncbi:yecA family protein [Caenispirillum salinarum AK4]|uniref:YecA family protein n=1 Tax=Caenispirillum salinarum AK4 TaxID=1238182 RepID=K9HUP7_9PROT|nr:UPF0149 family protein [Caenispirillum salinarum]EKV31981.1 yecA family protein [Caenispirillum salinarum AK4]
MPAPPDFTMPTRHRLERFLADAEGPSLPYVDGFLTAVAIGPDMLLPSQWWPFLWGEAEPDYRDKKQAETVHLDVLGRYNQILGHLDADNGAYAPILRDAAGALRVEDWSQGFRAGLSLMGEDWMPLFDDETGRLTVTALIGLAPGEDGGNLLKMDADRAAALRDEAEEFIPGSVAYIHHFWLKRQAETIAGRPGSPPVQRGAKVGRNDPCPCGSGKKYKKCCGAT